MRHAKQILGSKILSQLQQIAKYELKFRKDYTKDCSKVVINKPIVVFCVDGKTIHGGFSDRIRGLLSTFYYCETRGKQMIINWCYPFNLSDYLTINKNIRNVNYGGYISHSKKEVAFRFFNSYSFMDNDEKSYYSLLDTNKQITHVYTNVTQHEELYHELFNKLFTPTALLQAAIDKNLQMIGGKYISVSFRFIDLLGDFKDTYSLGALVEDNERADYIKHGINAINNLWMCHKSSITCILVTSDSQTFLEEVKKLPYIYIISGSLVHMDAIKNGSFNLNLKTFLDFFMISKAQQCYTYQYGKMFGATRFAKTAALIGGKNIIKLSDSSFN